MMDWTSFPAYIISQGTSLFRIHRREFHPAWFNSDGAWRFDPPRSHRSRFGSCYLGLEPLASYVEVFGRFQVVPEAEIDRRALSQFDIQRNLRCADLTDRTVLGDFGVTAAHSTGADYGPAQELAANLYDAGFDGIRYRVRHDPAMLLEGVALFGEPGETAGRLPAPKTEVISENLVAEGNAFHIRVVPSVALP
jgi:RES domain